MVNIFVRPALHRKNIPLALLRSEVVERAPPPPRPQSSAVGKKDGSLIEAATRTTSYDLNAQLSDKVGIVGTHAVSMCSDAGSAYWSQGWPSAKDGRTTRKNYLITFFHFLKPQFLYKIPLLLPWWSKDVLVENLQVAGGQLRNPPVKFRHERWLHLAIDQHPACPNRGRLELWPRKWFLLGRNPWR